MSWSDPLNQPAISYSDGTIDPRLLTNSSNSTGQELDAQPETSICSYDEDFLGFNGLQLTDEWFADPTFALPVDFPDTRDHIATEPSDYSAQLRECDPSILAPDCFYASRNYLPTTESHLSNPVMSWHVPHLDAGQVLTKATGFGRRILPRPAGTMHQQEAHVVPSTQETEKKPGRRGKRKTSEDLK